ncbi:MAG: class I tRNA ligase family protein [Minisyncoccia bacterium]
MSDKSERAEREERVLQFWKDKKIFEKTLAKKAPKGEFVFYDGPPFATGLPHYGSLLSSIIKDAIPRYKTMRGFRVRRRWGWDCHGLPIENMVEKELGIKNKKEIEEMGIAKFNRACRDSVLRFANEWKVFVDRVGRFVDYDNSYKTMDNSYIESVWWALKEIYNKGLLYEGRKVLLYCPRCETPLAKAEIAMDQSYKDVTEESVYVKFKVKDTKEAYLLAWTTTPWTLPGNVALAVGENIDYVEIKVGPETLILAKERLSVIDRPYEIVAELKGRDLLGMEYEPLFEIPAVREAQKKKWFVAPADFVNTEEGTGVVHTAVIYGEDDYELGLKLGLPMVPLLDSAGHFNSEAPQFIQGEYFKKAEKAIKEDLEKRKLLFKREMNTHSYPHCHRCGTALLYNALSSWFIDIQKKKQRMVELNEKINWIPEHLKHGRFLNNVESAPDWTISRNRYWASPLPIWKDSAGKVYVISSTKELEKFTKKSGNRYVIMRHGEALSNAQGVDDLYGDPNNYMTDRGKEGAAATARKLGPIDLIFTSPFLRTRETAEIVRKIHNLAEAAVAIDERLHEHNESGVEPVRKRVGEFLFEIDKTHKGKNILIVSHGEPLWVLERVALGLKSDIFNEKEMLHTSGFKEIKFVPFSHNELYELDLHRPYIDELELVSEDNLPLKRISEVIDGWVESGSMPFAEYHYPMENESEFKKRFPGDFIAEYIGQTRTWFYYMHAVATLLFDSPSFRNVVTTGNILAEDGEKMSKSKGNYTDPMRNLDRFGADALRYYLLSSVVMRAEDVRFSDEEVRQVHNQIINILWNSFKFYEMYAESQIEVDPKKSGNILDKWILARLEELASAVTKGFDQYDTVAATRPVRDFVSDFSTWYIRRSRERFKSDDLADRNFAIATTRYVLKTLAQLVAPITPFIAEDIYSAVKSPSEPESVHLSVWPGKISSFWSFFGNKSNKNLLQKMERTRHIVSLALEARAKANIKVRQPLPALRARVGGLGEDYLSLIKDEINVKSVTQAEIDGVELDTNIDETLLEEGKVRDALRAIQDERKKKGLRPKDSMEFAPPDSEKEFFRKHTAELERITNTKLKL